MRVDEEGNRLYWVNEGSATIQYIDLKTEKAYVVNIIETLKYVIYILIVHLITIRNSYTVNCFIKKNIIY